MRMRQGVRTGLGHGGITCVLQTQFSSLLFSIRGKQVSVILTLKVELIYTFIENKSYNVLKCSLSTVADHLALVVMVTLIWNQIYFLFLALVNHIGISLNPCELSSCTFAESR